MWEMALRNLGCKFCNNIKKIKRILTDFKIWSLSAKTPYNSLQVLTPIDYGDLLQNWYGSQPIPPCFPLSHLSWLSRRSNIHLLVLSKRLSFWLSTLNLWTRNSKVWIKWGYSPLIYFWGPTTFGSQAFGVLKRSLQDLSKCEVNFPSKQGGPYFPSHLPKNYGVIQIVLA